MPVAKVHISRAQAQRLLTVLPSSISQALAHAYQIPESDVQVLINAYEEGYLTSHHEGFIFIEILAIEGRSKDAKKALYAKMVENVCRDTSIPSASVLIMLHEMPRDNCGVRGGQMASEVELGFKVDV